MRPWPSDAFQRRPFASIVPLFQLAPALLLLTCLGAVIAAAPLVAEPGGARRVASDQAAAQAADAAQSTAKTWIGREAAIEDYIRSAPIARMEDTSRGVTRPKRAYLAPGGPVDSISWKVLPPRKTRGYFESYKSEIAAYELDKILELQMVPPKVEREINGETGVAVMWAAPTRSFADLGGVPKPPPAQVARWTGQLVRAKMFQNLIGDIDPNLGNWLVDPAWNLILIDHSRALTDTTNLVHEMQNIDLALWKRIQALSDASLTASLGKWLGQREIEAILKRRVKMDEEIAKLVRKRGETATFIR